MKYEQKRGKRIGENEVFSHPFSGAPFCAACYNPLMDRPPLLMGLVSDLFFSALIGDAARALGFEVRWVERADQVAPPDAGEVTTPRRPGEPLHGQAAALIALLVELQPALLIVDLNNAGIPWAAWIAAVKS